MDDFALGVAACAFVLVFFLTGIEIAFGIAITGLIGFAMMSGFDAAYNLFAQDFLSTLSSYSLTVIPLFILMGQIAFNGGIGRKLYDFFYAFIGNIRGGLAMGTCLICSLIDAAIEIGTDSDNWLFDENEDAWTLVKKCKEKTEKIA